MAEFQLSKIKIFDQEDISLFFYKVSKKKLFQGNLESIQNNFLQGFC